MKEYLANGTKDNLKILGFYQLIGGIIGLVLGIKMLIYTGEFTGLIFLLVLIIFGLYSYSVYVGLITIKLKEKWLLHSQINQIIQFFHISLLGYTYFYVSGIGLFLGFDMTHSFIFKFNFFIMSECSLAYNLNPEKIIIELNIISFLVLYLINRLENRIRTDKEIHQRLNDSDSLMI